MRRPDWNEALTGLLLLAGVVAVGIPRLTAARVSLPTAALLGAAAGAALYHALAGSFRAVAWPGLPRLLVHGPVLLVIAARAALEELAWRGFALGALATVLGPLPALGATSVLFALAHGSVHGRLRLVHCVTGGVFGGAYLATGRLSAAVGAHVVYNGLIAVAVLMRPRAARAAPGLPERQSYSAVCG